MLLPRQRRPSSTSATTSVSLGRLVTTTRLQVVRRFLIAHPAEIVVLFVQDESEATDNIFAIENSGLASMAFVPSDGQRWPSVREMLRRNQRLVVLAENNGGGAPFYVRAFDLYQDTSYEVKTIDAFTCSLNRGSTTNPLFLLNHWIDHSPASQTDAAEANGYEFLLARAQQCQQERRPCTEYHRRELLRGR